MPGATQSIDIDAPRELVFGVIVDYDRYGEFVPHLKKSRVKERGPGYAVVEMRVDLVREVTYTLRIAEDAPRATRWQLVEGPFKRNDGGWDLEDLGGGRTRASYRIDIDLGLFVPKAIVDKAVGQSLPANLQAFKARSEQVARR